MLINEEPLVDKKVFVRRCFKKLINQLKTISERKKPCKLA